MTVRAYLHIDQLAELTPWTPAAIRTMMARGVFKLGVHYFKPHGPRSRPVFRWAAIVELIEGGTGGGEATRETIALANGRIVNLNGAAKNIPRLHD